MRKPVGRMLPAYGAQGYCQNLQVGRNLKPRFPEEISTWWVFKLILTAFREDLAGVRGDLAGVTRVMKSVPPA